MGIIFDAGIKDAEKVISNLNEPVDKEGYKRIDRMQEVYIPDVEVNELKKIYSRSVVQDFDDIFHYSKEEREKFKSEHEKLYALRGKRIKCPTLKEYVEYWRMCVDVINEFADTNGVMPADKFKKLVVKGKIRIGGLKFPKCVKKGNKKWNWELIIPYILDKSMDLNELEDLFNDVEEIEYIEPDDKLPDDIQYIVDNAIDITDYDPDMKSDQVPKEFSKDEKKMLRKFAPEVSKATYALAKLQRKMERAASGRYDEDIEHDDFQYFSRYDTKKGYKTGVPKFKGDLMSNKDYEDYIDEVDGYIDDNTFIQYHGKIFTSEEFNILEVKTLLENNNWNLRTCFVDKDAERREKRQKKKDKKREEKIKKVLADIEERKNARDKHLNGLPEGINIEEYNKKQKKKKKKDKHKKEKKHYQHVLMDATTKKRYKNLKRYKKEMEDFSWKM